MKTKISINDFFNNSKILTCLSDNDIYQKKIKLALKNFEHFGFKTPELFYNYIFKHDASIIKASKCTIGFVNIIKQAKYQNLPFVVYMEDDICMHKDLDKLLPNYLENIPDDASILNIGYCNKYTNIDESLPLYADISQSKVLFSGSQCYLIFEDAYDDIIDCILTKNINCDELVSLLDNHKIYISNIPLFLQYDISYYEKSINDPFRHNFWDRKIIQYIPLDDFDKQYIMNNYLFNNSNIYIDFNKKINDIKMLYMLDRNRKL